eukprot:TRINITY_DN31852_c0_g1_i1.p1 TRINITY_DN31852_c0_g1~~TRINITY_DN31852_c0_g1_i1.p1  ORF type:complete len:460 (+),score=71.28 TRINITY_DN31852_c0_g1_i1:79-1458(+)
MNLTSVVLLQLALDNSRVLVEEDTFQAEHVEKPKCKQWCMNSDMSWTDKCKNGKRCGGCPECASAVGPPWESLENRKMSTEQIKDVMQQKFVVMANDKIPEEALSRFTDLASSFWQFGLVPGPGAVSWAQKNNKDFIPLLDLKNPVPKEFGKCSFHKGTCTADKIVEVLEDSKRKVGGRMHYLMGFNEPFGGKSEEAASWAKKSLKHADPEVAAHWWRTVVQPAAERTGLELVSPTMGAGSGKGDWGVKFLQACYDNRSAVPPCKVELIKTISVHHMVCYAGFWRKTFAKNGGDDMEMCDERCQQCSTPPKFPSQDNFYSYFKDRMRKKYSNAEMESFWNPYFDSLKIWVVPNSCGNDSDYNKKTKGSGHGMAEQYCESLTGQSCIHQEGSIKAFLDMNNIDKFSWYVTWMDTLPAGAPNREAQMASRMFDTDSGSSTPVGRAILTGLDAQQADCASEL